MSKGYVYILTNPSLREVSCGEREVKENVPPVKIGMTKDGNSGARPRWR